MSVTIVDVIESLGKRSDAIIRREKSDKETIVLPEEDKIEKAYELKMAGIPVRSIAISFKVSSSTVYNWLNQHSKNFASRLECLTKVDIISEHLQWLETLERTCLYEANQLDGDGEDVVIDEATGKFRKNRSSKKLLKLRYINAARSFRLAQIDLMKDTGVLPRAPEHIYHTLSDEKRTVDEKGRASGDAVSDEQLKESIIELLSKKRTLL